MVPFKVKAQRELLPVDFERRRIFCKCSLQKPSRCVQNIVFEDEAAFHMNRRINNQNNRYYALAGSHPDKYVFNVPFNRKKVSVWAGLLGNGTVIGPLFYEGKKWGKSNVKCWNNKSLNKLENRMVHNLIMCGGCKMIIAPCRGRVLVSNYLKETFRNRIIGFGLEREWPPRSPNVIHCDFFFFFFFFFCGGIITF